MKDYGNCMGFSFENQEDQDDYLFSKVHKNDLENDFNGISFSDTCSSFTNFDLTNNSKLNLSLEIDKKIDELIVKNIHKDMISQKIQADLNISAQLIRFCVICIIYSFLIHFQPFQLGLFVYSTLLLFLPFNLLSIFVEFKSSYMKYANELAKTIIYILAIHVFTCCLTFTILLILKLSNFTFFNNIHAFILFIPVFGVLFIFTLFWIFLYQGYKKEEDLRFFYFVLYNLIILNAFAIIVCSKVCFNGSLSFMDNILWSHIFLILTLIYAFDILVFIYYINNNPKAKAYSSQFFEVRAEDSMQIVLNILLFFCFICFLSLLGIYLDNKLEKKRTKTLFLLNWFFFLIIIGKAMYGRKKINNYFEWKKMVII